MRESNLNIFLKPTDNWKKNPYKFNQRETISETQNV